MKKNLIAVFGIVALLTLLNSSAFADSYTITLDDQVFFVTS